MRCLTLISYLRCSAIFWMFRSLTERTRDLLLNIEGLNLIPLDDPSQLGVKLRQLNADVFLVDDYEHDLSRRLVDNNQPLVVFDDLANRKIDCDVLIDGNPARDKASYSSLVPGSCDCLVGAEYTLVDARYQTGHNDHRPRHVHVFFGSTDPCALSYDVTRYLCEQYQGWTFSLVATRETPHLQQIMELEKRCDNLNLEFEPESLASGLLKAEYAIGAPGIATWERLAAGCVTGLISLNEYQADILDDLEVAGYVYHLCTGAELPDICASIDSFLSLAVPLNRVRECDWKGGVRLKDVLAELLNEKDPDG